MLCKVVYVLIAKVNFVICNSIYRTVKLLLLLASLLHSLLLKGQFTSVLGVEVYKLNLTPLKQLTNARIASLSPQV